MKINKNDILKIDFKENVSITELSTYKTLGTVKGVFYPKTEKELITTYDFLLSNNLPFKILGNGSNLLISPKSKNLFISTKKLKQKYNFCNNYATFSSSIPLAKAYNISLSHSLKGFEALAGIPATIGGAIKNNAGAFGQSIFDNLENIKFFKDGNIRFIKTSDIVYSYHSTNLKNLLILSAKFKLQHENKCKITQDFISFQKKRYSSQPKELSCGSVFQNPNNFYAGKLIEDCNLKGLSKGNAQISDKHANFIINNGNASFEDILFLINLCKEKVYQNFNIKLEEEIEIIQ